MRVGQDTSSSAEGDNQVASTRSPRLPSPSSKPNTMLSPPVPSRERKAAAKAARRKESGARQQCSELDTPASLTTDLLTDEPAVCPPLPKLPTPQTTPKSPHSPPPLPPKKQAPSTSESPVSPPVPSRARKPRIASPHASPKKVTASPRASPKKVSASVSPKANAVSEAEAYLYLLCCDVVCCGSTMQHWGRVG